MSKQQNSKIEANKIEARVNAAFDNCYQIPKSPSSVRKLDKHPSDNNESDKPLYIEPGFYARLSPAKDIRAFRQAIQQEVNALGFSDFAFVIFAKKEIDLKELYTLPSNFAKSYYEQGLYEHDEIGRYVQLNTAPITLSTLVNHAIEAPYETESTRTMQKIYALSKSYGYFDFYNTPIKSSSNNSPVMLSVTSREVNAWELKRSIEGNELSLRLLAEAIDYIGVRKFPEFFGSLKETSEGLTPRALHVLEVFANNDLSINEVADKLCISSVTAHQHIAAARRALNVRNNQAAIKHCILEGLIKFNRY